MSDPGQVVECKRHGRGHATIVCGHLPGAVGAGFFSARGGPTEDERPDAWCVRCEEALDAEGGWNGAMQEFASLTLLCSGCYDEVRAKNRYLADPGNSGRFRCTTCDEWHEGLPRDFAFDAPLPYASLSKVEREDAHLTSDVCEIGPDRFVRLCLEIPILGGSGPLVYGVWISLSEKSYSEYLAHWDDPRRYQKGPYFGWFSSRLPGYPDTVHLKTRAHLRPTPLRPVIELEPTEHPLAVEQRCGITQERFREIALAHSIPAICPTLRGSPASAPSREDDALRLVPGRVIVAPPQKGRNLSKRGEAVPAGGAHRGARAW
jgi:hypothetical protein